MCALARCTASFEQAQVAGNFIFHFHSHHVLYSSVHIGDMASCPPKKDLWTEAVDAMNSKYHLTIDPAHLDRLTVLKEIETDAGKSKEFREGRLFKFTNHKGKEVLLGDVVDGIVTWVSKSVTIGDTIVQYDPVHAALLWAANFYLQIPSESIAELTKDLVSLYTAILEYFGEAKKYYGKGTARRILSSAVQTKVHGVEPYIAKVTQAQAKMDAWLALIDASGQKELKPLLNNLDLPIAQMQNQISNFLKENELSKNFDWLSDGQYQAEHKHRVQAQLAGTGDWGFKGTKFLEWRDYQESSIFWLHGRGNLPIKLTIVALILYSWRREKFSTCAMNDQIVHKYWEKKEGKGKEPQKLTLEESTDLIISLLEHHPATIVVDALDECDSSKRQDLLLALQTIMKKSTSAVKIFLGSRDDYGIASQLTQWSNVSIEPSDNKTDIENFVIFQVDKAIEEKRLLCGNVSKS
ncbi:hypothetical protein BKA61DRAFT_580388 [Leptodontidium sp. MPI-SDFR-AT-0119]|nr:hypothetical protein BKA61DRAFT_580388 [Leptodontidium sp. MPI-SDFR-AT-0119]